jgi:hypothetical protein
VRQLCEDPVGTVTKYAKLASVMQKKPHITKQGSSTGEFMPEMMNTIIFREYQEWHKSGDPDLMAYILTFLTFGKKLDYEDDSLHAIAFHEWLGIEERLTTQSIPKMKYLKSLVHQIVPQISDIPFTPNFGSGAISEESVRGVGAKRNILSFNDRLRFAVKRLSDATQYPDSYRQWIDLEGPNTVAGLTGTARLMFVPKDLRKSRSICMEPNSYMFIQQHVRRAFELTMHDNLQGFVNLRDQTRNQTLAEFGSSSNTLDTLDLSSASDSMDSRIVKELFPPKVAQILFATRSSRVMTEHGVVNVNKFAPMGSALCFPVQTTVFTASVILAYMLKASEDDTGVVDFNVLDRYTRNMSSFLRKHVYRNPTYASERFMPFTVYGDDIICDSSTTDYVISILSELGFNLNLDKSFTSHDGYRESCGEHYVGGYRCTPIVFTIKGLSASRIGPSTYMSFVGMINKVGAAGYTKLHSHLINRLKALMQYEKNEIFFTDDPDNTSGIFSKNVHPFRAKWSKHRYRLSRRYEKWAAKLHGEYEIRVVQPVIKEKVKHFYSEDYGYTQWMGGAYRRNDEASDEAYLRYDPVRTRWGRRWIPAPQ